MGVTLYIKDSQFFIAAENTWDAYFAVMDWYREHQHNPYYFDRLGAADLTEALDFGWAITCDAEHNVIAIEDRVASISPRRADSLIEVFGPLAPFVRAGSYIVIKHDDSGSQVFRTTLRFDGVGVERETFTVWP